MRKLTLLTILVVSLFAAIGCTKKSTTAVAGKVTGVITVSPQLAATLKPATDVLYIIVREQQAGPPSAVKRISQPKFPLTYSIGAEDAMIPGTTAFAQDSNLTVAARISRNGNAMPAAGDLEGVHAKNPVHPGDAGVDVVIDRERN